MKGYLNTMAMVGKFKLCDVELHASCPKIPLWLMIFWAAADQGTSQDTCGDILLAGWGL